MIPTQTDFPIDYPIVPDEKQVHDTLKTKAKNDPKGEAGQGESNMTSGEKPKRQ